MNYVVTSNPTLAARRHALARLSYTPMISFVILEPDFGGTPPRSSQAELHPDDFFFFLSNPTLAARRHALARLSYTPMNDKVISYSTLDDARILQSQIKYTKRWKRRQGLYRMCWCDSPAKFLNLYFY
jgi:hypothetical protein